jgi:hypothetical protein
MNNLKFKKSLVAIATGAALAAAGMTAANAESLLFPYWSTEAGTTSVLSLTAGATLAPAGQIHYVWNYGSSCTHFDNYGKLTANDLIQQFVSQPAGTPALFGDTSTPAYFPPSIQTSGFLVVTDNAGVAGGAAGPLGSLRGQMVIASAAAGIVTSYSGIPQTAAAAEGDFSLLNATQYRLSWYPQSVVNPTSWFGVVTGNMAGAINAGTNWTGGMNYFQGGNVYGRNEDAYSGSMEGTITCSGSLTPASFMNSAQMASVTNGGLVNVTFTPGATPGGIPAPANPGTGVVLTKLETTTALGSTNTFITPEKATVGTGW